MEALSLDISILGVTPNGDGSETREELIFVRDNDLYHATEGRQQFLDGDSEQFALAAGCADCSVLGIGCVVMMVEGIPGRVVTYNSEECPSDGFPCQKRYAESD